MIEKILALNIKMQRKKNGITMRSLAKLIDVSPSFLSQVEAGKAIPSLLTLKRLADALNTTIGKLVGEDKEVEDHNPIIRKGNRILIDNIGRKIKIELLAVQNTNNEIQPYIINFDKNSDTGMFGTHKGQETGLVLKGVLELYYNNKTYVLNEGDSFYVTSTVPHHLRNINEGASRVLIVSSVPRF
ncbi:MAG: helix-turn-helix domain-containing protein [Spirochaetes bacterium]|nr:helix-turn-helix domain-containing protein [Spirochaetota bacterium]